MATKKKSPFDRRLKPRVDLRLAYGSITEVDSQAIVLGLFQGVQELSQAARAIDERMNGAITDLSERRMFLGKVGEIFILPAARLDLRADLVICAGMGRFDRFEPAVLQTVADNVARTLVRARVDEFALVLFGATRATNLYTGLAHLVDGFFRGVRGSRERNPLRSITVCETDRKRCDAIEAALAKLYQTRRSENVDVTLEKITLPEALRKQPAGGPASVILQATQEPNEREDWTTVRLSLLATGAKATALSDTKEIADSDFEALVKEVDEDPFVDSDSLRVLQTYGRKLAKRLVPPEIARALRKVVADRRIVLMHDAAMSRVPWETLCFDDWFPAARGGMSRQHIADHMPVARWLEQRRYGKELDLLLVVNPTKDLDGAEAEGRMVEKVASRLSGVTVKSLYGGYATKARVKRELESGKYDVLHYAGHTAFWPNDPLETGIICANHKVLTGNELAGLRDIPALVFFDSCESGRIGGLTQEGATATQRNIGLAESFLRSGVANYVGTHWVVSDAAAPEFVKAFYGALLRGEPIGAAVSGGRRAVRDLGSRDWADYIHYGSPDFVLKFPYGEASR